MAGTPLRSPLYRRFQQVEGKSVLGGALAHGPGPASAATRLPKGSRSLSIQSIKSSGKFNFPNNGARPMVQRVRRGRNPRTRHRFGYHRHRGAPGKGRSDDITHPIVKGFWDQPTGSWQYVFHDPATMKGAIVDPVLNFDPLAGATMTDSAEEILAYIRATGIEIVWILDTHPHADHFSAGPWLKERLGAPTAIGEHVVKVQALWKDIYNLPDDFPTDGRQWDRLFADGETFMVGEVPVRVMFSPGHTLASITYVAGDAAFVHDTLMMPDSGTSRADFPGGSAKQLYDSIRAILDLPADTRLFVGHDYAPEGREPACVATVAEHKAANIHLKDAPSEAAYRAVRDARDATLPLPKLMLAALQVNIRGGRTPRPENNGRAYLKVPLDYFTSR
jgi:glyoxylase-like metal-dependent hydrolase (beta-lactamase superfamily II)